MNSVLAKGTAEYKDAGMGLGLLPPRARNVLLLEQSKRTRDRMEISEGRGVCVRSCRGLLTIKGLAVLSSV